MSEQAYADEEPPPNWPFPKKLNVGRNRSAREASDLMLMREAVVALRDRVHIPSDRTCCPDCADDADAIDLITKLQERLLNE